MSIRCCYWDALGTLVLEVAAVFPPVLDFEYAALPSHLNPPRLNIEYGWLWNGVRTDSNPTSDPVRPSTCPHRHQALQARRLKA